MHGLLGGPAPGVFFSGDLIGFAVGLAITILLLVLTLRAVKLPGTPLANAAFAACALLWTAGGLVQAMMTASGVPRDMWLVLASQAVQLSGAAAFPIPILSIWLPVAPPGWQSRFTRMVRVAAYVAAVLIAILAWSAVAAGSPASFWTLKRVASDSASLLLAAGAFGALRRGSAPRPVLVASLVIVGAVLGASVVLATMREGDLAVLSIGGHLVLLVVLCGFFLFARFRYADVFVRYSVRILLAGSLATLLAMGARQVFLASRAESHLSATPAVHVFGVTLMAGLLILVFAFADAPITALVIRWLFRSPDYRAATRRLAERLRDSKTDAEVAAALEDSVRDTLAVSAVRLVAAEKLPPGALPDAMAEGEAMELDPSGPLPRALPVPNVEWLVAVASGGRVSHFLLIAPGATRPAFVTHDLNFLHLAGAQCGNRLDALRFERAAIERQSREALLLRQVAEAELRALRAQVNPHFLFNSLNTIADLVVRNPEAAEAMTLRLAEVFRHVLANSSSVLTSVREEMEFLRTYLYIEEARFGERLQVAIDVAPEVAGERIPSLILQPLVENALKHGLGPKTGVGHLWISAQPREDHVRLNVEDDGVGPAAARYRRPATNGLGLVNVADRLRALYQERAQVCFEAREAGGSRVTVLIPRGGGEAL